jgi:hypothetical protein
MANDVYTYVSFERISEEGEKKAMELFSRLEGWDDDSVYEYVMSGVLENQPTDDESYYGFNSENVGAKWAYIEDPSEYGFTTHSAWCVPAEGIKYIFDEINKVDPKFIGIYTYFDEMPNFVGWQTYREGYWDESQEWEWDDLLKMMLDANPELEKEYNAEEEELTERGQEILWDIQDEFVSELVDEGVRQEVKWIYEAEAEEAEEVGC